MITNTDGYKTDHRRQYPEGTELVYSNFTPRDSRIPGIDHVVVFGIQYFIKEFLIKRFNEEFFNVDKDVAVSKYKRRIDNYLGVDSVSMDHIEKLHDLGYLPLIIKALPEGTKSKIKVPVCTVFNTHKDFAWLVNFIETIFSTTVWGPMTSATIANEYRCILDSYANQTSDDLEFVDFQGHDFSMRGMYGLEAASASGASHLLSFKGTDTIPAIDFLEKYYDADCTNEMIGVSVPATEHSVMCMGGSDDEFKTFDRIISDLYPTGIVSIVSDTWDYWSVYSDILPRLKDKIESRDGKVVIRPDSGCPIKIICGDSESKDELVRKGSIEALYDIFGGTVNSKGYKVLSPKIGLIYGDSITIDRCKEICRQLKEKGFASTNVVFGIGSFTYQYNTRDTFGFAMKATYGEINGKGISIFKNPKTDKGIKKSAKGLLQVSIDRDLIEECSWSEEREGILKFVFHDGDLLNEQSLFEIRQKLLIENIGDK